ncbi:MAG: TRAP transporter substrate-binding protein [Deltaproteobacteria bacterium]|jgi:TRAP-type mannitol/chloroaromatic compound transport system substrate-binding protein|nr:TRAP transporter substrate-binding protein [Deltaproteobacteria bacterium]
MKRREFIKKAGLGTAAAVAATAAGGVVNAPFVHAQDKTPIRWRLQTYAGATLAEHVIKPQIDAFNKAANGEMVIELFTADQLVPQSELFRAVQNGTIDAAQSDEDSMASPADVAIFGAYFPLATRYSLDVPALFEHWGLNAIWEEAYAEIEGVSWLGAGSWDPCNFATTKPLNSLKDLNGLRVYSFPSGGKFMSRFGVVPVTLPYEDVQMALQTGELDGVCWSGITEDYTVGWADVCKYYLTNNICGAWIGSYFANSAKWAAVPEHLKTLFKLTCDSSHYYRQHWYWWGEASYRVTGQKLALTTIPEAEWKQIEDEAIKFWDEVAPTSPRRGKVIDILKQFNDQMVKAGPPYRY